MTKTPGQIAYEGFDNHEGERIITMTPTWERLDLSRQSDWQAAANAVLEEAAKVVFNALTDGTEAAHAATIIRSLKSNMCQASSTAVGADGVALRALQSSPEWMPIETAPKDGTPVLLCDARTESMRWAVWHQHPAHAQGPDTEWLGWRDGTLEAGGEIVGVIPTHWMPLPSPPQTGGQIEEPRSGDEVEATG